MHETEFDVIVAGGGPAGVAAAICAARSGAKVILVERYGFLGGMASAALVGPFMRYYTTGVKPQEEREKETSQEGHLNWSVYGKKQLNKGIFEEIIQRLEQTNGVLKTNYTTPFDHEELKYILLEMVIESGAEILLHSFISGVTVQAGQIKSLKIVNKSGEQEIKGKLFIDCTGDGDVAARAGASFEVGSEIDGKCQPATLMFKMGGVNFNSKFGGLEYAVPEDVGLPAGKVLFFMTPRKGEVIVNMTRVTNLNALDGQDLTRAEIEARKQVRQVVKYLTQEVKGFEEAYLLQTGTQIGIRESRRIKGRYTLTAEDVIGCKKFEDGICRTSYPVDIHNPSGQGGIVKRLPPEEWYEIPYRCLLSADFDNLMMAGRCISSTHEAHGSLRVMANCFILGQAAGTGAGVALKYKVMPHEIALSVLMDQLTSQNVF